MDALLIREVRFPATHHYRVHGWTPAENRAAFGSQSMPHEHHWRIRIEVAGEIDPETGFVVDLRAIDTVLHDLVGDWRGSDLNERIPEVKGGTMQPSTEAIARWLHERLSPRIPGAARLHRVHVWESEDLGARYPA